MKYPLVPVVLAFLLAGAAGARAASATLAPVADTTLFQNNPNNNLGASSLAVGATAAGLTNRALLRFDLSSIPSNALIDSVTLNFIVSRGPFTEGEPSIFQLHRFLKPWTEGAGTGTTGTFASSGETTWNSQFHGSAAWSQPGGAAGAEYSSTVSASVPIAPLPVGEAHAYAFETTPDLVADVQAWLSGAAPNHGWLMASLQEDTPGTARRIVAGEDPTFPPRLQVEYSLPPQFTSVAATNGAFEIRFTISPPYCNEVQFRDSLLTTNWSVLTNICATTFRRPSRRHRLPLLPLRLYRLRISGRVR